MTNIRNEYTFTLGEHEYTARPTFRALAAIESKTGNKITAFIVDATAFMAIGVEDIYTILYETIKAADKGVKKDQLEEDIIYDGLQDAASHALEILSRAFIGPKELEEASKKKPLEQTMSQETGESTTEQP